MLYTGVFFDFGFIKLTYCFQQHLFCIDFRKVLLFENILKMMVTIIIIQQKQIIMWYILIFWLLFWRGYFDNMWVTQKLKIISAPYFLKYILLLKLNNAPVSPLLIAVWFLFLIGVINIMLKKFSSRLGISVPLFIIRVFHMKKVAHPFCIHLEDFAPALLVVGCAFTIIRSAFRSFLEYMSYKRCPGR